MLYALVYSKVTINEECATDQVAREHAERLDDHLDGIRVGRVHARHEVEERLERDEAAAVRVH